MTYLTSTILAAALALSSVPVLASGAQGPDIEAGSKLTMRECLAMQAAKNDGASRDEMKRACKWTVDGSGTNGTAATNKTAAVGSAPYGSLPNTFTPPPKSH